jgi:hypothetical protein
MHENLDKKIFETRYNKDKNILLGNPFLFNYSSQVASSGLSNFTPGWLAGQIYKRAPGKLLN